MKFQDYIQKHKYLLLIIAVLFIMLLAKTDTEWNLLRTVWEILLPFLVGCIMAFIFKYSYAFLLKKGYFVINRTAIGYRLALPSFFY